MARAAANAFLLLSVAALLIGGVGRAAMGKGGWDLTYFRTAGIVWLEGGDPYDTEVYDATLERVLGRPDRSTGLSLHNPPNSLPLVIALAAMGPEGARVVLALLNGAGAILIAWSVARWLGRRVDPLEPESTRIIVWRWVPALTLLLYAVHQLIVAGQISLFTAGLLFAAWPAALRNRPWSGAALALAAVKPQYLLLPLVWLVLERRWRPLAVFAAASLILLIPAMVRPGLTASITGFFDALSRYETFSFNALGDIHTLGLPSVLAFAGVPMPPALWLTVLAGIVTVGFWLALRGAGPLETLAVLVPIQMLLAYGKQLEIWMFAPMLALLWHHYRPRGLALVICLVLLTTLIVPNSVVHRMNVPIEVVHVRTLVLLGGFGLIVPWALQQARARPRPST